MQERAPRVFWSFSKGFVIKFRPSIRMSMIERIRILDLNSENILWNLRKIKFIKLTGSEKESCRIFNGIYSIIKYPINIFGRGFLGFVP